MATPHLTESRVACPRCCTAPVCPGCGAPCPICHGSGTAAGICALCDGPVAGARVPCRCSPSRKPAPGPLGFSVGRAAFHRDCFFRG